MIIPRSSLADDTLVQELNKETELPIPVLEFLNIYMPTVADTMPTLNVVTIVLEGESETTT